MLSKKDFINSKINRQIERAETMVSEIAETNISESNRNHDEETTCIEEKLRVTEKI